MTAPYLEAAPRISVFKALSVQEHEACLFKDGDGRRCGILRVKKRFAEGLLVEYAFYGPGLHQPCEPAYLPLISAANSAFPERRMFRCPRCNSPRSILAFNDRWGCRKCLKLRFRSQVVDPRIRLWERKQKLLNSVGKGRPPNMHHRTYQKRYDDLAALQKRLGGTGLKANIDHLKVVTAHWGWSPEHEEEIWAHLSPAPLEDVTVPEPPPVVAHAEPDPATVRPSFDFDNLTTDEGWKSY